VPAVNIPELVGSGQPGSAKWANQDLQKDMDSVTNPCVCIAKLPNVLLGRMDGWVGAEIAILPVV
jgi:hypothetical protein